MVMTQLDTTQLSFQLKSNQHQNSEISLPIFAKSKYQISEDRIIRYKAPSLPQQLNYRTNLRIQKLRIGKRKCMFT